MSGFDDYGLEIATIEEIKAGIEADQQGTLDPAIDVSSDQPLGQNNGIFSKRHAQVWELAQYVWNSLNPNAARGVALDNTNALIGLPRLQKKRSTVALTLTLVGGTTVTAGSVVAVAGQSSNTWQSVNTFTAIVTGDHVVGFESTQEGNVSANPSTITDIQTPVAGWSATTNGTTLPLVGRQRESDEAYRLRRIDAQAVAGESTVDAIRSDLLQVKNVVQAVVQENDTNGSIGDLPPHSLEAIIFDDANQASDNEIAQVIWNNKPGGITVVGLVSAQAIALDGGVRIVSFSRGVQRRVQISFTLQVLSGWAPSQLDELRAKIVAAFRAQRLGEDVLALKYKSIAIAQKYAYNVAGYTANFFLGTPEDQDLPVAYREIATLADVDLTITVVNIGAQP